MPLVFLSVHLTNIAISQILQLHCQQAAHTRGEGGVLHAGWRAQVAALERDFRSMSGIERERARVADRRASTGQEDAQLANAAANDFDRRCLPVLCCVVWSYVCKVPCCVVWSCVGALLLQVLVFRNSLNHSLVIMHQGSVQVLVSVVTVTVTATVTVTMTMKVKATVTVMVCRVYGRISASEARQYARSIRSIHARQTETAPKWKGHGGEDTLPGLLQCAPVTRY
jgi:hypothetical protein